MMMLRFAFAAAVVYFLVVANASEVYHDVPYNQLISDRYVYSTTGKTATWPVLPIDGTATDIASARFAGYGDVWVTTSNALWLVDHESASSIEAVQMHSKLGVKMTVGAVMRSSVSQDSLLLASAGMVYRCHSVPCEHYELTPTVNDLAMCSDGNLWAATQTGLWLLPAGQSKFQRQSVIDSPVVAVTCGPNGYVAASSAELLRVYIFDGHSWRNVWATEDGVIDGPVNVLGYSSDGTLWTGAAQALNLMSPPPAMLLDRIDGVHGLPTGNITSMAINAADGAIWCGTPKGAMRYDPKSKEWRYLHLQRWMPGEKVRSVATDLSGSGAWVMDEVGISHFTYRAMTLADKAAWYQSMMEPVFDRHGLAADVSLINFGDTTSYHQHDNDNDGLWTSMYLASQVFRYAVTKEKAAKEEAWKRFTALEFLNDVTGVPGLMARSVVTVLEGHGDGGTWYNSTEFPGWIWKGDTSSDEVTGHMFVYPLVHDLLAETEEERARPLRLINNTVRYITENGFYLLDITGKPTTWGVWAPEKLNFDQFWFDGRGLNSLQMLSYLLSAYRYTQDPYFLSAFKQLCTEHGYDRNMVNEKIAVPQDENFSDDELAFLPFFSYMYTLQHLGGQPTDYAAQFMRWGLDRQWKYSERVKSSLWNFIYGTGKVETFQLEDAIWCLQRWPMEMVNWPYQNSERADVRVDPYANRGGSSDKESLNLYAPDERGSLRWNANVFTMDGGSGFGMTDPTAFLLPYWMGRYYGFIKE